MTDNRLNIFVSVVKAGSFTGAARSLGVSQPAISQNIKQLEEECGGPLLERSKGTVALTERGRRFFEYAERILTLYARLDAEMHGGAAVRESLLLDLGDGNRAEVGVRDGKLEISLKSANN